MATALHLSMILRISP